MEIVLEPEGSPVAPDFLNQHGDVALQIIVLMVRRLRNMDEMVGDMVFLDVPTRVAEKLIELVNTYEASPVGGQATVPMGQSFRGWWAPAARR